MMSILIPRQDVTGLSSRCANWRRGVCYSAAVKPAPFAYRRPVTLDEAASLLAEFAPQDGRVLAGGQSLVPIMNFRLARPGCLIDINAVAGLDRLAVEDGGLRVGARVRHAASRIGVGGAEATPRRIEAAETVLRGERLGDAIFRAAAAAAAGAIDPIEDQQTDTRYRRELVEAMTYRALKQACA